MYKKRRSNWTEEEDARFLNEIEFKVNISDLRIKFNRTHGTIVRKLKELNKYVEPINKWTEQEDSLLREYRVIKGFPYSEIAKLLNCDVGRIKARAKKLKISRNYNKIEWNNELDNKLTNLINEKLSIPEIAGIFNCDEDIIRNRCRILHLESLAKKLIYTKEQLDLIIDMYYDRYLDKEIGKKLNMSEQTIKHIRRKEGHRAIRFPIWTEVENLKLLDMVNHGSSIKEVKSFFKCRPTTILNHLLDLIPNFKERSISFVRFLYSISSYSLKPTIKTKLNQARKTCVFKHREFKIVEEDIEELFIIQNGRCFYTGDKLETEPGNDKLFSIDRIDSSLGYVKENIALCTWEFNRFKSNQSLGKMKELATKLINNDMIGPEYHI